MASTLLKTARSILKYLLPVMLAVAPVLALYGAFIKPVPAAVTALYPDQYPLLVGVSETCGTSCRSTSSYGLFPSAFRDPKVVTVTRGPSGISVSESPGDLLSLLGSYLVVAMGTWLLWRKPRTPPNNSFKPNPLRGSA